MAIEIKRSPVLEGESAEVFNRTLHSNETNPPKVSEEKVRAAIEESKKILESLKANHR